MRAAASECGVSKVRVRARSQMSRTTTATTTATAAGEQSAINWVQVNMSLSRYQMRPNVYARIFTASVADVDVDDVSVHVTTTTEPLNRRALRACDGTKTGQVFIYLFGVTRFP